jgi:hypothetical protein
VSTQRPPHDGTSRPHDIATEQTPEGHGQPSRQAVYCDSILTGLALMEAFRADDRDLLEGMIEASDPVEALIGVLTASSVLINVMALHPDREHAEIAAAVRSRAMRNLATA